MTVNVLERPTLVLNRNWQPVNVATVARALVLLWNESARVVDPADYATYTWEDWSELRPRGVLERQAGEVVDNDSSRFQFAGSFSDTRVCSWESSQPPKLADGVRLP